MLIEYWGKNWNQGDVDKILAMLIAHENDPVRKNLALAKSHAVSMINAGYNPRILKLTLLSYFDDDVVKSFLSELDE